MLLRAASSIGARRGRSFCLPKLLAALAVAAHGHTASAVAVFDDFSDLNDTVNPTWTHLSGAVGSTGQTWDATTGRYRLHAPSNSQEPALWGYGFVGAYAGPQYADVRVTVDMVDFPNIGPSGSFFGVAARLNGDDSTPVEGSGIALHGYSYQYESSAAGGEGEMVLSVLHGGGLKDIGSERVTLDNTKDYRFILEIVGNVLHGQTWELDGTGNPVALVGERIRDLDVDPVGNINHDGDPLTPEEPFVPYASGYSGVFGVGHVFNSDADFTIDNFKTVSVGAGAGDFDADGDVDGADLARWKASMGVDAMADADSDGDSDGADFLVWQRNRSAGGATMGAVAAVPEPTGALLTGVGLAALGLARRRAGA
jgi:hypothetical protein